MTDKVQKIREKIKMVINRRLNLLNGDYFELNKETDGFTNEIIDIVDSLQEEPVSEKECMYSKDNYTDEDRKVLCEGCEEECKFNKKEDPASEDLEEVVEEIVDPTVLNAYGVKEIANRLRRTMIGSVSEDLEQAIDTYLATYFGGEKEKQDWPFLKKMAIHFANWQKKKDDYAIEIAHMAGEEEGKNIMKQQLMAKAVDGLVVCNNFTHGYKDILMEIPSYLNVDDEVKVIIIKED